MAKLVLATQNKGKIDEFKGLLGPAVELSSLPPGLEEVPEEGSTYIENARQKAEQYFQIVKAPVLADDSGLVIDVLNGEPGVFSARYGGAGLSWPQRWDYVYSKLKGFPEADWKAHFLCVLYYYDGKIGKSWEGKVFGLIAPKPAGTKGFGYDPIFYSSTLKKTFGEASIEEKQQVSHRAVAVRAFLKDLPSLLT